MTRTRIMALIGKEWLDLRRNPGALTPVALVALLTLVLPFVIVFGIPAWTGERLSDDGDLARLGLKAAGTDVLTGEGRTQYFLLQQFLLFFLLTPITGAMALAAHAVVGEKQARTLEPLLVTPVTTVELLVAKVLGAIWPSLVISWACVSLWLVGIHSMAEAGVAAAMVNPRMLLMVLWVGPAAALVALQAAIIVSSRVNDARTAQQVGVLLIVPITVLILAQFIGSFQLTDTALVLTGAALVVIWLALVGLSVALFQRETILTRWR